MPGNFFSASCQYIRNNYITENLKGEWQKCFPRSSELSAGKGASFGPKVILRMGNGIWSIYSRALDWHPFGKPCDLSVEKKVLVLGGSWAFSDG
jgi:hypothetical protein